MNTRTTALREDLRGSINRIWWLLLARGIFAVIFGLIAVFATSTAAGALIIALGIYSIADGLVLLVAGIRHRGEFDGLGWVIAQAALSILAGVALLIIPSVVTFTVFGLFVIWSIVIWSVAAGALGIRASLAARRAGGSWVLGVIANVLTVLLGLLLAISAITQPVGTALGLLWIVGLWAVVFGIVFIVWSFAARKAVTARIDLISDPATTIQVDADGRPLR